uniref:Uncharacterized protein n=1 Tax=Setaria viridis TaxID=4556 RepID=A0A4U6T7H0_SETVI|nr:hypothetical protein SEVIR_9G517501v2 [Setaria viridis]
MNMPIHKLLLPSSGQSPERTTQPGAGHHLRIWTAPTNPVPFLPDERARHSREPESRARARAIAARQVRPGPVAPCSRARGSRLAM